MATGSLSQWTTYFRAFLAGIQSSAQPIQMRFGFCYLRKLTLNFTTGTTSSRMATLTRRYWTWLGVRRPATTFVMSLWWSTSVMVSFGTLCCTLRTRITSCPLARSATTNRHRKTTRAKTSRFQQKARRQGISGILFRRGKRLQFCILLRSRAKNWSRFAHLSPHWSGTVNTRRKKIWTDSTG